MTTVAIDKEFNIAADSQWNQGDYKLRDLNKKVVKLKRGKYKGWYLCMSGAFHLFVDAIQRLEDDVPLEADSTNDHDSYLNLFLVSQEDKRILMTAPFLKGKWRKHKVPAATGTGGPLAMAAMYSGASAKKAVSVAVKMDVYSGGRIQSILNPKFEG